MEETFRLSFTVLTIGGRTQKRYLCTKHVLDHSRLGHVSFQILDIRQGIHHAVLKRYLQVKKSAIFINKTNAILFQDGRRGCKSVSRTLLGQGIERTCSVIREKICKVLNFEGRHFVSTQHTRLSICSQYNILANEHNTQGLIHQVISRICCPLKIFQMPLCFEDPILHVMILTRTV